MSKRSRKEVEAIVSGMGVFMTFISNLVELVKKFGGTMENIYRLATPEGSETLEAVARIIIEKVKNEVKKIVYFIFVDYAKSIEKMIKLGKYNWINDDITSKHFPTKKIGKVEMEVKLFHFDRNISSEDAIKEMDKEGYRPAELHDLLAFGAKYPNVQREFSVVALGSVWQGEFDNRLVAFLHGHVSRRSLSLRGFVGDWGGDCRFAAVPK